MKRQIIPDVIDGQQALCCLPPHATVKDAAILMAERRIGAILIMNNTELAGILTERDLVFRVLAKGRDPKVTSVGETMTANPTVVSSSDNAWQALEIMRDGRFRHLPVVDGGDVLGIVSIRDLYEAVRNSLEQELRGAETLIFGDQYGSGAPSI